MKNSYTAIKFMVILLAGCFLTAACNRPMLQPPSTQTLPIPIYGLADTRTPAPAVQAATITRTAHASSSIIFTRTFSPTSSPTPGPTTTTPYPTPAWCPVTPVQATKPGKLRLAYASQGNLWLLDEGKSTVQLTQNGDIGQVSISDDGKIIVYTRQLDEHHAELWAINTDGSHDRRLLGPDELTLLDGSKDALGVLPTMLQWEPGSHHLSFYTYPLYDAVWIFEPSSPWLIDLDTGKISAAPYHGGNIVYSPDGKRVVVFSKDGLSLVKMDGSDLKQNVLPGYHGIREGEAYYYPLPFWSRDSTGVQVALPEQDELYSLTTTVSVWRVTVDGNIKKLGRWYAFSPTVYFSPDLAIMAFWPFPAEAANDRELHLARFSGEAAGKSEDAIYLRGAVTANLAWSPDSQHFIFQMGDPDKPTSYYYLGEICQQPIKIMETAAGGVANWVDATRFLMEVYSPDIPDKWELHLGGIDQEQTKLMGEVTAYDWAIIP